MHKLVVKHTCKQQRFKSSCETVLLGGMTFGTFCLFPGGRIPFKKGEMFKEFAVRTKVFAMKVDLN